MIQRHIEKLSILLVALFAIGCSDVKLHRIVPEKPIVKTDAVSEICLEPPEGDVLYSKVIFVVDKSGSNNQTDPNGLRSTSIMNFIQNYSDNEYYKWGVIGFQEANGVAYTTDDVGDPDFVNAADATTAVINDIEGRGDNGCTPYIPALIQAKRMIELDMERHPEEKSFYNVFFLSDGFPRIVQGNNNCQEATVQDNPNDPFLFTVRDLRNLDSDHIFLSTIYYTPGNLDQDRGAAAGLSYMAREGGGTFTDVQNGGLIEFNEIKVGEIVKPWKIKNTKIISYNLNSAFCEDDTIDVDSDMDGICDKDEERYNELYAAKLDEKYEGRRFDPQNRYSLDPDYSDAFVWRFGLQDTSEGLLPCGDSKIADEDFDLFNSCEESMIRDDSANGPTPQWTDDMINQNGSSASRKNFDSDGDGFLDMLEFFALRLSGAISAPVNFQSKFETYTGGIDAEEIIYHHRHFKDPTGNKKQIYDTTTKFSHINELGQNCYTFEQDNLPLMPTKSLNIDQADDNETLVHAENENVILIYFIATEEDDSNGKGVLYHTYQKALYQPEKLGVEDEPFSSIQINPKFEDFEIYHAE